MKLLKIQIAVIIAFVFSSATLIAQGDFVSAAEAGKLMKNKNTVVVSAQSQKNYKNSHIKNAVFIDHHDLYKAGEPEGLIKSTADLAKYFGSKGVSDKNTILIYDDGTNKYSTRIYWILKYIGAPNVKILHKDMGAWRSARIMITKSATKSKTATFTPSVNASISVDYNYVKANLKKPNVVLIDVREITEYNGTSTKPVSKGHLPGAKHIEWKQVETANGALLPAADLTKLFTKNGITKDKTVILYCATSVRSGIVFVALKSIGYSKVKVYDGAYNEWVSKGGELKK